VSDQAEDLELSAKDAEELADAVRRIEAAMTTIVESGLNRRALVTLIHDDCKVGKRDISKVLDSLEQLGVTYLNYED
jgi:hypothetical protein